MDSFTTEAFDQGPGPRSALVTSLCRLLRENRTVASIGEDFRLARLLIGEHFRLSLDSRPPQPDPPAGSDWQCTDSV